MAGGAILGPVAVLPAPGNQGRLIAYYDNTLKLDTGTTWLTVGTGGGSGGGGGTLPNITGLVLAQGTAPAIVYPGTSCAAGTFIRALGVIGDATCATPAGGGNISGTGVANQIAYFGPSSNILGSTAFTFDGQLMKLGNGGTNPATSILSVAGLPSTAALSVARIETVNAAVNAVRPALALVSSVPGVMADGFGTRLDFVLRDSDNVDNINASISVARTGTDGTGLFKIGVAQGGLTFDKIVIDGAGQTNIYSILAVKAGGEIRLMAPGDATYTGWKAPSTAGNVSWIMPTGGIPAVGTVLTHTGSGQTAWSSSSAGVTGSGVANQVAYWTSTGVTGITGFTYNPSTVTMRVGAFEVGPKPAGTQWLTSIDGSNVPHSVNGSYGMRGWMNVLGTDATQSQVFSLNGWNHNTSTGTEVGALSVSGYAGPEGKGGTFALDAEIFVHGSSTSFSSAVNIAVHNGRTATGAVPFSGRLASGAPAPNIYTSPVSVGLTILSFAQDAELYNGTNVPLSANTADHGILIQGPSGWVNYITGANAAGAVTFQASSNGNLYAANTVTALGALVGNGDTFPILPTSTAPTPTAALFYKGTAGAPQTTRGGVVAIYNRQAVTSRTNCLHGADPNCGSTLSVFQDKTSASTMQGTSIYAALVNNSTAGTGTAGGDSATLYVDAINNNPNGYTNAIYVEARRMVNSAMPGGSVHIGGIEMLIDNQANADCTAVDPVGSNCFGVTAYALNRIASTNRKGGIAYRMYSIQPGDVTGGESVGTGNWQVGYYCAQKGASGSCFLDWSNGAVSGMVLSGNYTNTALSMTGNTPTAIDISGGTYTNIMRVNPPGSTRVMCVNASGYVYLGPTATSC